MSSEAPNPVVAIIANDLLACLADGQARLLEILDNHAHTVGPALAFESVEWLSRQGVRVVQTLPAGPITSQQ